MISKQERIIYRVGNSSVITIPLGFQSMIDMLGDRRVVIYRIQEYIIALPRVMSSDTRRDLEILINHIEKLLSKI